MTEEHPTSDVVVAGAGMAGLTAAILLARAGLRVTCIDPSPFQKSNVGESLDWSSPALLSRMGFDRDELVAAGVGTYKRQIRVTSHGEEVVGQPVRALGRWPLRFERVTLHLHRERFHRLHWEAASSAGVELVRDHVTHVDRRGDRVLALTTRTGRRFTARWYLDATGRRRIIGRAMSPDVDTWGSLRIALWSQRRAPARFEGTTLHVLNDREMRWAWAIPLDENCESVGTVMPRSYFTSGRGNRTTRDVLIDELSSLLLLPQSDDGGTPGSVKSRAFQPFVSRRVTGPNWLLLGEAAAFVDPITSLGVTAALRHASEAADLIIESEGHPLHAKRRLNRYEARVRRMSHLYCRAVEALVHDPLVRNTLGVRRAFWAYVPLGYTCNALYNRINPTTPGRWAMFSTVVWAFHVWISAWLAVAQRKQRRTSELVVRHVGNSDESKGTVSPS